MKNGTYLSDQITPIADPTRAGYTFAGWSREDGTQITTGQISGMPAGTLSDCGLGPGGMTNDPGGAVWHRIRILRP